MDLGQIASAVQNDTSRIDLSAAITRWVAAAVIRFHESDFYFRDRVNSPAPVIVTPGNEQTIALPARFRKFQYIYKTDSSGNVCAIFKEGVQNYPNAWYEVVGSNVILRDVYLGVITTVSWAYYAYPDLSAGTSATTWLTDKYSEEVIDLVKRNLYQRLGDMETARSLEQMVLGHLRHIQSENLEASISQ